MNRSSLASLMIVVMTMFCLFLIGCGEQLTKGTIIEKRYVPESESMVMVTIGDISYPQWETDPEQFIITIDGWTTEEEIHKTRRIRVSKEVYESYQINDFISLD